MQQNATKCILYFGYVYMLHLVMLQSDGAMLTLDWQIQMLTAVSP